MLSNVLITIAGVGLIYIFFRHRKKIIGRIQRALDFRNPLRNQQIEVVSTTEQCRKVASALKLDCREYKVLGFDCEWVTVGGSRRPVSLLQLASQSGLCGLFRLNSLRVIPTELRDILQDEDILKIGVVPQDDARALAKEYGVIVASTLDLRHLAFKAGRKPLGLSKMSKDVINIELDKDWRIRCSDWEANVLSERQLKYAAADAHVAIEVFKKLSGEILPRKFLQRSTHSWKDVWEMCEPYIDLKFSNAFGGIALGKPKKVEMGKNGGGKQQTTRALYTRSKRLYDNCLLQAPDGEILCTCDRKKSDWYISQNLGTLVSEEPYTVRLNFEPAGRAVGDVGKYYTLAKLNQCVVCGREDAYIRKNIVPREYRKHFPVVMKSHTSHDVLLLCPRCHQLSNISDLTVRHKLSNMCDAPLSNEEGGMKVKEVPRLRQLRSAARALLYNASKIPEEKKEKLRVIVLENYPNVTEITEDLLQAAADVDIVEELENYSSHGEKVVNTFKSELGGLIELEKLWRQHFIKTMQPKYLPEFWSVNHNENRLEIRINEGRIEKTDIELAGLKVAKTPDENLPTEKKFQ